MRRTVAAVLLLVFLVLFPDAPEPPAPAIRNTRPVAQPQAVQPSVPAVPDLPLLIPDPTPPITTVPSLCAALRNDYTPNVFHWCPTIRTELDRHTTATPRSLRANLDIVACESRGNPDAVNLEELRRGVPRSKLASGLYQHMPRYFGQRARNAGVTDPDIFDPVDNITTGVWLWAVDGPHHWPNCG